MSNRKIAVIGLTNAAGINFSINRGKRYEFEAELARLLIRDGLVRSDENVESKVDIPAPTVIINDALKEPASKAETKKPAFGKKKK